MVVEFLFWTNKYGRGTIEAIPKECPTLQILQFFNIVQNVFDHPPPPFEHLLGDFRPLRGHLSFFSMGLTLAHRYATFLCSLDFEI